jgi:REP-associated tyrosine transposase
MGEGMRSEFHVGSHEGRILGDDTFADDVLLKTRQKGEREYSLAEVVGEVCAHFRLSEEKLKAPRKVRPMTEARAVAAAIVRESPHLRMTDLAKLLARDLSALGKAAQRIAAGEGRWELVGEMVGRMRATGYECPKL